MKNPTISKLSKVAFVAVLLGCLILTPLPGFTAPSNATKNRIYILKASFIYNFTKFIHWPSRHSPTNGNNLYLCILGEDPFGPILDRLAKRHKFKHKKIVIKRNVRQNEMNGCHIAFISNSENAKVEDIVSMAMSSPILTIGDTEGYSNRGIGINFVVKENKIRFEINNGSIMKSGLKVSSELLDLAITVK